MAEPVAATEYFQHVEEWHIIVCRQCRHAVWPQEVQSHLQGGQHKAPVQEAKAVAAEVYKWPGVIQCKTDFTIPAHVSEPIPEIPLYTDGWRCRLDPEKCEYICRKRESVRKHWRERHSWAIKGKGGRPGQASQARVKRRFQQNAKPVYCQRLFPSRVGSAYFEIRNPDEATPKQVHASTTEAALRRAWERANIYWDAMREKQNSIIQPGETDEVNPWLKRTGWIEYLKGCDRKDLLRVIRKPGEDDDDDEDAVETAIWAAMGTVAARSQQTVQQSGVMLRLEAIRTEAHQTRYHPLQPYGDPKSVVRRCQPWQQMLMFFVRTRKEHDWRSPGYRFSRRQDAAFRDLMAAAQESIEQESENGEESDEGGSDGDDEAGNEAGSEEDEHRPLNRIEKACLAFCIELLNQRIHNQEYDMALVCGMAVLGVDPFQGGFRDPETYPPILSSIIKIAHFMVVQQAEQIAQPAEEGDEFSPCGSPCDFGDSGYESDGGSSSHGSPPPRTKRHRSSFDWVHRMTNEFMVRGSASPTQWLLDLRTYGLKIHYNTTAIGHVDWKDKYTLAYKELHFTMDEFRGMVHDLVAAAHKALLEDLLFAEGADEIPGVPWDRIYDDPTNGEVGWNFIQDQRSKWPVHGQEWLFQRIQSQERLRGRFVNADTDTGIDKERMRDYMRQVARFRGLLLILMHISGGQPARGPEILSVRHRNTAQGGHRNMFIEDGLVVFVTKHHKGYQMSGDVKIIHRYLPREVGELVVWYTWLALPFIQRMEAMLWKKESMSDHMWPMDVEGQKWTTDRMKKELQRASTSSMGQAITVAAYREIAIAISRQWVRGPTQFQNDESEENEQWRWENMGGDAADEQATHSPHIAGLIYARNSMEMSGTTSDKRRQFRAVSTDWHRFLAFESVQVKDEKTDLKRKRCAFEADASDEQTERRVRLCRMDATAELQRMMRREVMLRSAQGEAMAAIQKGENFIVAVMPTGAGKSVLFMLPAWVEPGGLTIVVVPLKALRKDMVYRCEGVCIKVGEWTESQQCDGASIILVTPEKAAKPGFKTFIGRMKRIRRLDRIVIDECHVMLNDQLDFRKQLQEMGQLGFGETQLVLLTATLPPIDEEKLFERMYWRREEVRLIRASTVRKNIRYSVVDGPRSERERFEQLEAMVEAVLSDPEQPEGKVVVMCESKPKVERIVKAGLFPCEMFHAGLPEETKEETLEEFRNGNVRAIVATGAFGMGIDIASIRLIVFVDNPRNMRDYGQASGRAGRDGLPSEAIIIRGGGDFDDQLVRQYIDPGRKQCRRIDIDTYLDGDATRQACQEGEERCDICSGDIFDLDVVEPEAAFEPVASIRSSGAQGAQAPEMARTQAYEIGFTQAPEMARTQEPDIARTQVPEIARTHAPETTGTQAHNTSSTRGYETSKTRAYERSGTQAPTPEQAQQVQIRREIRQQDQQRRIPEARRIRQVQTGAQMQIKVQQQLEKWKGVCVVCHQAGQDIYHSITKCSLPQGQKANQERAYIQRSIKFVSGIACFKCGVPHAICDRWDDGFGHTERRCQFWGILVGVVYGAKHAYPEIWARWVQRARNHNAAVDSDIQVMEYLGSEAKGAEISSVQLLEAFMWITIRIEELRDK